MKGSPFKEQPGFTLTQFMSFHKATLKKETGLWLVTDASNNLSHITNQMQDRPIFQLVLVAVWPATMAQRPSDIHNTSAETLFLYLQKSIP